VADPAVTLKHMSLARWKATIADFASQGQRRHAVDGRHTGALHLSPTGGYFGSTVVFRPSFQPAAGKRFLGYAKIQERPMAVNGQVVILR